MAQRKIALIYNPRAGALHGDPARVTRLVDALAARGIIADVRATAAAGDATRLAHEAVNEGAETLIVCGGDGTINEAAQPLVGSETALAVWPCGTANVLAKEMRPPRSADALATRIAERQTRTISVGRAVSTEGDWQRYFLLMAGVGLDATVIQAVNPEFKKRWGIGAYWVAGFRTLAAWPLTPFELDFNGERYDGTFAIIANAANYASIFTIAPRARMEDEHLDVCLFNSRSRLTYLGYAALAVTGSHTLSPQVVYRQTREAVGTSPVPTPVQLDGELVGHLPMRFESVARALSIIG
jgi:YegS/Rv2252/BmrU family lipid kinase